MRRRERKFGYLNCLFASGVSFSASSKLLGFFCFTPALDNHAKESETILVKCKYQMLYTSTDIPMFFRCFSRFCEELMLLSCKQKTFEEISGTRSWIYCKIMDRQIKESQNLFTNIDLEWQEDFELYWWYDMCIKPQIWKLTYLVSDTLYVQHLRNIIGGYRAWYLLLPWLIRVKLVLAWSDKLQTLFSKAKP